MRIFIADDDVDDLELFQSAIRDIEPGVEIIAANDGYCLLENLHTKTPPLPDIIFLDINMPKFNGFECLQQIRQEPRLKHVPVVVLSTSDRKNDVDAMWEHGANCYIKKPNTYSAFKHVLKDIIDNPCPVHERKKDAFLIIPEV